MVFSARPRFRDVLGGGTRGVYSIFMHGRSGTTVAVVTDPRIPTIPERSMSALSPTRQTLLAPKVKRREVFSESQEGFWLHPTKNRL